ncbi:hypothetical protein N431DRAFT_562123 [Stipitochalara longipes BDJ]|nr:hypothetical protein N431DRAFT_562123 [Stipitochalara longipes BDJ]
MRSSTLFGLATALFSASPSHSFELHTKDASHHHSADRDVVKRQTTSGTVLYSSPPVGQLQENVGSGYIQHTVTFTATLDNVMVTVLIQNNPSDTLYDDFSMIAVGDTTNTNLIQNPGFETGSLASWVLSGEDGYISNNCGHSGSYCFADGAVGQEDSLSQSVSTVAGTNYMLSFWIKNIVGFAQRELVETQVLVSDFEGPALLSLTPATDSGSSDSDGVTNVGQPVIQGNAIPSLQINVYANGELIGNTQSTAGGTWSFQVPSTMAPGSNDFTATCIYEGAESGPSVPLLVTYIPSGTVPTLALDSSTDTGVQGDGITWDTNLILTGSGDASTEVTIYDGTAVLGVTTTDNTGAFSFTTQSLAQGEHSFTANEGPDVAGNPRISASLAVTITALPVSAPTLIGLIPDTDTGVQGDDMTSDAVIGITGTGEADSLILLYDGSTAIGNANSDDTGAFVVFTPNLSIGVHSFTATVTDLDGDVSSPSTSLTITIQPPVPTIFSLTDGTASGGPGTTVTYNDPVTIFGTALADSTVLLSSVTQGYGTIGEGTTGDNGAFYITTDFLDYGDYEVVATVQSQDGLTSDSSEPFYFSIVVEPPTLTGFSAPSDQTNYYDNGTTDNTPTILGTAVAGSSIVLLLEDGSTIGTGTSDDNGNFAITTSPLSIGTHNITAESTVYPRLEEDRLRHRDVYSSGSSEPLTITILPQPSVVPSVGDCNLLGCYKEPTYARALTDSHTINYSDMSVEICAAYCSDYTYFAVENGGECYCGNIIAGGTNSASADQCESVCDGNPFEYCGGYGYLDLYQCGVVTSSTSSSSLSTSSAAASSSVAPSSSSYAAVSSSAAPSSSSYAAASSSSADPSSSSFSAVPSSSSSSADPASSSSSVAASSSAAPFSSSSSADPPSSSSSSSASSFSSSSSTISSGAFSPSASSVLPSNNYVFPSSSSAPYLITNSTSTRPSLSAAVTTSAPASPSTSSIEYTTSTVSTTVVYTITSCAATVTDCSARLGSVTTETIDLYTTICPVTATETAPASSIPAAIVELTTSTVYTTIVSTIIHCAATVIDCPAESTLLTTATVALYTTVCPVAEASKAIAGGSPGTPAVTGAPATPAKGAAAAYAASSPAVVAAGGKATGVAAGVIGASPSISIVTVVPVPVATISSVHGSTSNSSATGATGSYHAGSVTSASPSASHISANGAGKTHAGLMALFGAMGLIFLL